MRSCTVETLPRYYDVTPSGCWHWRAYKYKDGYGRIYAKGQFRVAHRWVYELLIGPIPEGLQLDHTCHNPQTCREKPCPHRGCVNPDHLEPVTPLENTRRATRNECIRGHAWDVQNTYINDGRRSCRACGRERSRQYMARKKATA